MTREVDDSDAIVEIYCPFCGKVVLEATDFSKLSYDRDDDEEEESEYDDDFECDEDFVNVCEHLAFSSDWAYVGPEIHDKWKEEMRLLASAMEKENEKDKSFRRVEPETNERIIDDFRMSNREDKLNLIAAKALPDYDFAYIEEYVNKEDGISGTGGADYGLIFLKKRDKRKPKGKKSTKEEIA